MSHIFTQTGWFVSFCLDDFPGQIKGSESLPNFLFLRMFRTGGTSFCPLSSCIRITTPWGEPSSLWTFESILQDQRLPVEHKLDVCIPPLTGTLLLRLWQFSYFIPGQPFRRTLCLLQQTGPRIYGWIFHSYSKISNTTFAMSPTKRISFGQPATSILLIYSGDLYSSIQNLRDVELLAERQMPAHLFYNCISSHYDFQQKGFLSTQAGIKLLNWKPSISSFDSFIFSF